MKSLLLAVTYHTCYTSALIVPGVLTKQQQRSRRLFSQSHHRSDRIRVYIEDTDAFNVVFYANYFRYLEYALLQLSESTGPMLLYLDEARFKVPARLGDELEVTTITNDEHGYLHTISRLSDQAVVLTAKTRSTNLSEKEMLLKEANLVENSTIYFNDIDARTGSISLDACLRWFERARSNLIGGPDELASLLEAAQIAVVVCRVDGLSYHPASSTSVTTIQTSTRVNVKSKFVIFEQQVAIPDMDTLIAHATVTCLCSDVNTGKPVGVPGDLKDRLLYHHHETTT
mmetsp:Transcript_18464/g.27807  ORF Transcript_18464/g.27807 Transcript_18464/m.27807 type:complete len:286 (-) Transcript_18464:4287-5144(-)